MTAQIGFVVLRMYGPHSGLSHLLNRQWQSHPTKPKMMNVFLLEDLTY